MTVSSRRTFPNQMNGQWKRETWRDQTISETMDSSRSTKTENKWAKDIPTQRNAQRHRLLHMTLERHKYMHTQMQKIYYCLLNAHMWTKDVHIDKRDRAHVKKTQYTHTHTHTQCCLLIDVFAPLAVGCFNV